MLLDDQVAKMMIEQMGKKYKKHVPTSALKMDFAFSIETNTVAGTASGKAGDWLAMDANGKFYAIDNETFASMYRPHRKTSKTKKEVVTE